MDPAHTSVETPENVTVKDEIDGITEITIQDQIPKKIGQAKLPTVYSGCVKSGSEQSPSVPAYIFIYRCQDGMNEMANLFHQQRSISGHPNVMRPLGYSKGTKDITGCMCVAFQKFECTFADLLRPASGATEMGRFSEYFIKIVSGIAKGLKALEKHGFGCPNLEAGHVAIIMENNSATAKIWYYSACTSENKDNAWVKLGGMLLDAANNNFASSKDSLEIQDLCRKMIDGQLKGLDILGHSALLSVQEKFQNVLSLWSHISVNCTPPLLQNREQKQKYTLEEYLDVNDYKSYRPDWIHQIRKTRVPNSPKTFRELVDEMRDVIEHEVEYVPENMTKELTAVERANGKTHSDLEHSFRGCWPEDFLKIQLWASNHTETIKGKRLQGLKPS